jgi:hypothetical protein
VPRTGDVRRAPRSRAASSGAASTSISSKAPASDVERPRTWSACRAGLHTQMHASPSLVGNTPASDPSATKNS